MAEFSLQWHPHPDVWALVALLAWAYVRAMRVVAPKVLPKGAVAATRAQKTLFGLALFTLFVAADWPVHEIAEGSLYSIHMVQHMLFSLVMAPLFLLGTPSWMFRALIRPRPIFRVLKVLSRPFIALLLFNSVLVLTHWPLMVEKSVGSEPIHFGLHALLVISSLAMWMPVLSPVMEIPRLAYPGQMVYLFLQSLVPTVPASFLTLNDAPLYKIYEAFARPWGISALTDQRTAGLIMKILGGFILWGVIAALWFRWWNVEKTQGVDVLKWHDVDTELNRVELSR